MRIPPIKSTIARAVQPDYVKWNSLLAGMHRSEVEALLGLPIKLNSIGSRTNSVYGYITYPSLPFKWSMAFCVVFDHSDHVQWKCDPFGGVFPTDGKPTKPVIVSPQNSSFHAHFPRILDVRWTPSAGMYPIIYDLELGSSPPGDLHHFRDQISIQEYGQPYALLEFPGSQPGRVRVRGRNALGEGPWSDFHVFRFDAPGTPRAEAPDDGAS